ncbi:MAG: hypothetical protein AAGF87_15435 [Bacteroidota bacterium]
MERIFDPNHFAEQQKDHQNTDAAEVSLKRQHLWLSAQIAGNCFGDDRQIYAVFYPQRGYLLLAPMSDSAFKSLHDCSLVMLKVRNANGDKSLSLQEIIIDNDLNPEDRPLKFSAKPGIALLQVYLE